MIGPTPCINIQLDYLGLYLASYHVYRGQMKRTPLFLMRIRIELNCVQPILFILCTYMVLEDL